jgi:hypothetical protein
MSIKSVVSRTTGLLSPTTLERQRLEKKPPAIARKGLDAVGRI